MQITNQEEYQKLQKNQSLRTIEIFDITIQKHRRKSCCCYECGKLSQYQFKHMNLQNQKIIHQNSNLKKFQSYESTYIDSCETNITSKITFPKVTQNIQESQYLRQQTIKCINKSFELHQQSNNVNKSRTKSCCCDECGKITTFQEQTKMNKYKHQNTLKHSNFRVKRNLDALFRGISPIEIKQELYQEEDENCSLHDVQHQFKRPVQFKHQIKIPQKQQINGRRLINFSKSKIFAKTNSNSRELNQKSDINSPITCKLNLPVVKSSYAKTREMLQIYDVQHPKFHLKNPNNQFS